MPRYLQKPELIGDNFGEALVVGQDTGQQLGGTTVETISFTFEMGVVMAALAFTVFLFVSEITCTSI